MDAVLVAAFRSALLHQLLIIAIIFLVLLSAWAALRTRAGGGGRVDGQKPAAPAAPEPTARRVLRVGFGGLWLVDGLLRHSRRW